MVTIITDIGKRVRELRTARGLTQDELGLLLGIKKAGVQKIEAGKSNIGVDKLMILCETFRVFPSSILYGGLTPFWDVVGDVGEGTATIPLDDEYLLGRFDALAERRLGTKGMALIVEISHLNDKGMDRTTTYVRDLMRIEDYRKSENPN